MRAGLEGLRRELPTREVTRADPETLPEAERARHGVARLLQSLEQALNTLESDAAACGWFPAPLLDAYLRHKRAEIEIMAGLERGQRCARYAEAY